MGRRETAGRETGRGQAARGQAAGRGPGEQNAGWTIFSYLLSGMAAYGLIGWLVAWATHIAVFTPVGALVGLVLAIGLVIFRYGRPS
jgi:hypothetical protein